MEGGERVRWRVGRKPSVDVRAYGNFQVDPVVDKSLCEGSKLHNATFCQLGVVDDVDSVADSLSPTASNGPEDAVEPIGFSCVNRESQAGLMDYAERGEVVVGRISRFGSGEVEADGPPADEPRCGARHLLGVIAVPQRGWEQSGHHSGLASAAFQARQRSLDDRRVVVTSNPDGTANLSGSDLPAARLVAFSRYLNKAAKDLRRLDKVRTMDQLRADILLDILEGTHTRQAGPTGGVHMHVALTTLVGFDDQPADLAGYGPVIADVARQTAKRLHDDEWTFTVTDEATGKIVCTGTTKRRPTPNQRRQLQARYRHCVWPGCRMPSVDCDLDHNQPHAEGGCRHNHNLAPLCRYHHRIRHNTNWTYRKLPNNNHQWTSPLGHTYTTNNRSP